MDRWAELLLDTGKRNNLINFRDGKSTTAEIVFPDSNAMFERAESGKTFEVFDPQIIEDEVAELLDNDELKNESKEERKTLSKEEYIDKYQPKVTKQSQILVYTKGKNPINTIRSIDKKATSFIEETGENVAYVAFGFIHWRESQNSNYEFAAPILLMPIQFSRESSLDPYHITTSGDELELNPTFSYKIAADFGIHLPNYEDEGLENYLSKIATLISPLKWTVSNECKIGIFSFLKINMYKDLKNNAETILKNKNVQAILGEPSDNDFVEGVGEIPPDKNPLIELHNVVDADSSQIDAIELSKLGQSFVLQGPPGTGKSQTITNIIAEALYGGKTVLFVSEKLAALNVVYDKLRKANLAEFCLELHSHKSSKKLVIDDLCRTLKMNRSLISAKAEGEISSKENAQKQLDDYARELHLKRKHIEKSLFELYESYYALKKSESVDWDIPNIENKDQDYLKKANALLEQYVEFIPSVGYDYHNNPWYGYLTQDLSYQTKATVKSNLESSSKLLNTLIPEASEIVEEFNVPFESVYDAENWRDFFSIAKNIQFITPKALRFPEFHRLNEVIERMSILSKDLVDRRNELEEIFDDTFFDLDGKDYNNRLNKLYSGFIKRLTDSEYKQIINNLRLSNKLGQKVSYEDAKRYTDMLAIFQEGEHQYMAIEEDVKDLLGPGYAKYHTDWDGFRNELNNLSDLVDAQMNFGGISSLTVQEFDNSKESFKKHEESLQTALENGIDGYTDIIKRFDKNVVDLQHCQLNSAKTKIEACISDIDRLDNYCTFRTLLFNMDALGIKLFIDKAISENTEASQIPDAFKKRFYYQWIETIIHSVPALASFNRISQENAIKTFAEKDREQFEISKAQIRSRISAKRPSLDIIAPGSSVAMLLREGEKKRKQKPIRRLISEMGDIIQVIKPCFLMSPLSVSTFLDSGNINFDLVIFDEASQIFPQDAICSIYRGKQLIVVGDSKQMPPTSFFSSTTEIDDSDEETGDITDFESILDICSTVMKQLRLRWHYRSRYEQLIAFSNKNYYDNDLITFPSARADGIDIGVDYYHVDGLFDRKSKTNLKEAEKIVELIYKHIDAHPNRSLGVVAFSVSQQDLIEKLLSVRRQKTPEKESFFRSDAVEPFFIKNLETVQGDERDTIIFSIAYGFDTQGRFLHNFGPLNRVGGERRLNVAVTRAKSNIQVVSSIHYYDIDLSRTSAEGSRLLREYLDYAENGEVGLERSVSLPEYEVMDSDFEMDVCDFLREKGFTVDAQVGCSGYRIDLGLRKKDSSDYVLAIECDGATYHSSKNARDRDRLRQEVLERMGWRFYRVWSTDWYRNNKVEKDRLMEAATKAINNAENNTEVDKEIKEPTATFESVAPETHLQFPKYKEALIDEISSMYMPYNFLGLVREILDTEAPLSEEFLLKRIVHLFDREKVTNYVQSVYESHMENSREMGIVRRDGFLYLSDEKSFVLRVPGDLTRDIKYIALEELAAGMMVIIKHNISLEKQGLYHTIANLCGTKRIGNAINERLDKALRLLSDRIRIDGDIITLR